MIPLRRIPRAPALAALMALAGGAGDAQGPTDLAGVRGWPARLARDARLSFSARSAQEAAADLEGGLASAGERAVALMAIGCGGAGESVGRLESWARVGEPTERRAATLALGELGGAGEVVLLGLLEDPDPGLVQCAAFALIRSGSRVGRERAALLAEGEDLLARVVRVYLGEEAADARRPPGLAADLRLTLRWEAARRYGFVDGVRWGVHLTRALAADQAFLDRLILTAAADLGAPGVRDHLLETALAGGTPERLEGVVAGIPGELARVVEAGIWTPTSAEWFAILRGIRSSGQAEEHVELLLLAPEEPEVRAHAGLLLVGAGVPGAFGWIEDELEAPTAARRVAAAEALGGLADPERLADLAHLRRDPDPGVRAAALVSLVRVGHGPAADTLHGILGAGPGQPRRRAIEMLCRASTDRSLLGWLEEALLLGDLEEGDRVLVEVSLVLAGRLSMREELRERLRIAGDRPGLRRLLVRALARGADQHDLALMRGLFPDPDDAELNAELALALIRSRDHAGVALLRAAIWQPPWNRSVLASALLVRMGGIQTLHDELSSPPSGATPEALRRVGFALGEWGGLGEVEVLARRRRASDPALQGAYLGALTARTR